MRVALTLLCTFAAFPGFIEMSSNRRFGNNLGKQAEQSSAIQENHPLASGLDLPLTIRLTTYIFSEDLGLLTRGNSFHYRKMLTGKVPILAVGDYAVARLQVQNVIVCGIFNQNRKRVKVHMGTRRVELMSKEEQIEFPIGNELQLPGLVKNNSGVLVVRGSRNFPNDLVPLIFHDELRNNPHFVDNTQKKHAHLQGLNPNIDHSSRQDTENSDDNIQNRTDRLHGLHPHIVQSSRHSPENSIHRTQNEPTHSHGLEPHIVASVPHISDNLIIDTQEKTGHPHVSDPNIVQRSHNPADFIDNTQNGPAHLVGTNPYIIQSLPHSADNFIYNTHDQPAHPNGLNHHILPSLPHRPDNFIHDARNKTTHPHDPNLHIVQSPSNSADDDYLHFLNPNIFNSPSHSPDHQRQ